jgi:hypothetical protein
MITTEAVPLVASAAFPPRVRLKLFLHRRSFQPCIVVELEEYLASLRHVIWVAGFRAVSNDLPVLYLMVCYCVWA